MSSVTSSVSPLLNSREDKFPQTCWMLQGAHMVSVQSGTDCKVSPTPAPTSSATEWVQDPSGAKCSEDEGKSEVILPH